MAKVVSINSSIIFACSIMTWKLLIPTRYHTRKAMCIQPKLENCQSHLWCIVWLGFTNYIIGYNFLFLKPKRAHPHPNPYLYLTQWTNQINPEQKTSARLNYWGLILASPSSPLDDSFGPNGSNSARQGNILFISFHFQFISSIGHESPICLTLLGCILVCALVSDGVRF